MKIVFKYAALVLLLVSPSLQASDCFQLQSKQLLRLTTPATSRLVRPVDVQFQLKDNLLIADFEVRTPTINAKEKLGPNEYPYQGDVVELFVSVAGRADGLPYFEFQVSPYGNTMQVRVDDLKKPFINNLNMGLEHQAIRTASGWKAQMIIPLNNLGWDGDPQKIVGNAYSILGVKGQRSFYSLSLPVQEKASFHKPQFFKPLLKCD